MRWFIHFWWHCKDIVMVVNDSFDTSINFLTKKQRKVFKGVIMKLYPHYLEVVKKIQQVDYSLFKKIAIAFLLKNLTTFEDLSNNLTVTTKRENRFPKFNYQWPNLYNLHIFEVIWFDYIWLELRLNRRLSDNLVQGFLNFYFLRTPIQTRPQSSDSEN